MKRLHDYLDMAAHCAANARRTSDPRYRSFLVDMAEGWCERAQERARELGSGVATGLRRLTETANEVADLAASETQPRGHEERMLH
jgi:hypothetical protein